MAHQSPDNSTEPTGPTEPMDAVLNIIVYARKQINGVFVLRPVDKFGIDVMISDKDMGLGCFIDRLRKKEGLAQRAKEYGFQSFKLEVGYGAFAGDNVKFFRPSLSTEQWVIAVRKVMANCQADHNLEFIVKMIEETVVMSQSEIFQVRHGNAVRAVSASEASTSDCTNTSQDSTPNVEILSPSVKNGGRVRGRGVQMNRFLIPRSGNF